MRPDGCARRSYHAILFSSRDIYNGRATLDDAQTLLAYAADLMTFHALGLKNGTHAHQALTLHSNSHLVGYMMFYHHALMRASGSARRQWCYAAPYSRHFSAPIGGALDIHRSIIHQHAILGLIAIVRYVISTCFFLASPADTGGDLRTCFNGLSIQEIIFISLK